MSVKVIKLPPRNVKQGLEHIVEECGDDMKFFMLVGLGDDDEPFCFTSSDCLAHLSSAKLVLDIAIHDLVEVQRTEQGA